MIFSTRHNVPAISRAYTVILNCDIGAPLPKSVFLPHPFGIVIHRAAQIGEGVVINHQVTIGGDDLEGSAPAIGDGVYIGAGAKILGRVVVGKGATIGANAIVTRDVPEASVIVGANRILNKRSEYATD